MSDQPSSKNYAMVIALLCVATAVALIWAWHVDNKLERLKKTSVRTMTLQGRRGLFIPDEDGGLWIPQE